jgi:hypothetical protein
MAWWRRQFRWGWTVDDLMVVECSNVNISFAFNLIDGDELGLMEFSQHLHDFLLSDVVGGHDFVP